MIAFMKQVKLHIGSNYSSRARHADAKLRSRGKLLFATVIDQTGRTWQDFRVDLFRPTLWQPRTTGNNVAETAVAIV